jgi:2-polyprenyl-6-methoxyphenol hydroxylase-like FAD-dependent oxidoreductase
MKVLVIGGGIGGLCLAHGLRGAGVEVPVVRHRSVSRIRLREVLLRGLGPRVLNEGRAFARYSHTGDGRARAHFTDGATARVICWWAPTSSTGPPCAT